MKKTLLAAITATLLLGSHAMAAKVTYEDAVASSADFYEHNNSVNKPPQTVGLTEGELQDSTSANQMGKWVQVGGAIKTTAAGAYSSLLAPSSVGQQCLKGEKGLIMVTERECVQWNSGGWHCVKYGPSTVSTDSGYRAECR